MKASVGETVHYFIDENPDRPLAAMVTHCHDPSTLNLTVFSDGLRVGGEFFTKSSCTPWTGDGERQGHWLRRTASGASADPKAKSEPKDAGDGSGSKNKK